MHLHRPSISIIVTHRSLRRAVSFGLTVDRARFTNSLDVGPRSTLSGHSDDAIGGSTLAVRGAPAPQPRASHDPRYGPALPSVAGVSDPASLAGSKCSSTRTLSTTQTQVLTRTHNRRCLVKEAKTPQKPESSGKEPEEEASLARLEAHLIAVLKRAQKVSSKARRSPKSL